MTNREIIANHNGIAMIQSKEEQYRKETGQQLLQRRIRVTFAIKKNIAELREKAKPYQESLAALQQEYRNLEEEEKDYQERRKAIEQASGEGLEAEPVRKQIFREGKSPEEFAEKITELLNIDVGDVNIQKINLDDLDGLQLSSNDLDAFMFMIG